MKTFTTSSSKDVGAKPEPGTVYLIVDQLIGKASPKALRYGAHRLADHIDESFVRMAYLYGKSGHTTLGYPMFIYRRDDIFAGHSTPVATVTAADFEKLIGKG